MTLMFYLVVTLGGELRCWSLLGLKLLITAHSYSWMKRSTVEVTRRAQRHFTRDPGFNPERTGHCAGEVFLGNGLPL